MGGDTNQEESSINEELQTILLVNNGHDRKGGMKTMPFIIVNEAFERVASYGLLASMILYLMEVYNLEAVTATIILSIWGSFSNGLSIFGAFISDSLLGRFRVIVIGSLSSLLGMTFLWLTSMIPQLTPSSCDELYTSCSQATRTQLAFLFATLGLLSIGTGCIRPCSIAFGADQLKHHKTPNTQRLIDSYFNWYYASAEFSVGVGFTVVVYIQDHLGWQIGFAITVFIMFCSALMFLLGSFFYVKVKITESPFLELFQVLTVAFNNRKIILRNEVCYNRTNEMEPVELTESLRFLNKACVRRDSDIDSPGSDPWRVSTVEKVESLKSIIRIVPVWSTKIFIYMSISQSFATLQAKTMNRNISSWLEIPAASFGFFTLLTVTIWVMFYDRILVPYLAKYTHEPRGLSTKTRMGIGLLFSVIAMAVAAIVETTRRDLARSNSTAIMSAMWLVPQYALLGLADGFHSVGQLEYYYSELPKSMSSLVMALFMVGMSISGLVGSLVINIVDSITSQGSKVSWLSTDINEGHIDYYYWLLSFLNLLNFSYYLICCQSFSSSNSRLSHELEGE